MVLETANIILFALDKSSRITLFHKLSLPKYISDVFRKCFVLYNWTKVMKYFNRFAEDLCHFLGKNIVLIPTNFTRKLKVFINSLSYISQTIFELFKKWNVGNFRDSTAGTGIWDTYKQYVCYKEYWLFLTNLSFLTVCKNLYKSICFLKFFLFSNSHCDSVRRDLHLQFSSLERVSFPFVS